MLFCSHTFLTKTKSWLQLSWQIKNRLVCLEIWKSNCVLEVREQRYRFFFFPGKSLRVTHQLKINILKKKQFVFYIFSQEKLWATPSIYFKPLFFLKWKSKLTFFFPPVFGSNFFFWISFKTLTHSLETDVFFFRHRLKKNFFTHSPWFDRKVQQQKTFPGKQKTVPLWNSTIGEN